MAKPLVLLLDDNLAILEALPLDLEPEFDVECAATVPEAVEKIKAAKGAVDVAIVDMKLGEDWEGGLKAIQEIRALYEPPEIIVLTAYGSKENAIKCMAAGAFSYVEKSGRIGDGEVTDALIKTIRRALEIREFRLDVKVALEAIVVLDMLEVIVKIERFGWYAGRELMHDLRQFIISVGEKHELQHRGGLGDSYLLTYGPKDSQDAELGVVNALEASFELLDVLATRNQEAPDEHPINVSFALHFGEVDVIKGERGGPNISFTFRLRDVSREIVENHQNRQMESETFPMKNYVLCSETIKEIIERRRLNFSTLLVGSFELKNFPGSHKVYLVSRQPGDV